MALFLAIFFFWEDSPARASGKADMFKTGSDNTIPRAEWIFEKERLKMCFFQELSLCGIFIENTIAGLSLSQRRMFLPYQRLRVSLFSEQMHPVMLGLKDYDISPSLSLFISFALS